MGLLQRSHNATSGRRTGGRSFRARLELTTYFRNFCSRSRGDFDPADVALVEMKRAPAEASSPFLAFAS